MARAVCGTSSASLTLKSAPGPWTSPSTKHTVEWSRGSTQRHSYVLRGRGRGQRRGEETYHNTEEALEKGHVQGAQSCVDPSFDSKEELQADLHTLMTPG